MKKVQIGTRGKRGIVLAAVALMVGSALYLNWQYADDLAGTKKTLGESTLVNDTSEKGKENKDSSETESEKKDKDKEKDGATETGDYFATARLTRQQARDSAIALLEEAAGKEGADEEVLNEASKGIQVLAAYTMSETQIENLVTAKGYEDCVAFMSGESISVVVGNGGEELSSQDVAKIKDIVISETGYSASQIKILESGQ